jgi:hypothetical protein
MLPVMTWDVNDANKWMLCSAAAMLCTAAMGVSALIIDSFIFK